MRHENRSTWKYIYKTIHPLFLLGSLACSSKALTTPISLWASSSKAPWVSFSTTNVPKALTTHSQLKWYIRLLYLKKIINIFLKLLKYLDSIGTAQYIKVFNKKTDYRAIEAFFNENERIQARESMKFHANLCAIFWMGIKMQHFYIG